MKLVLKQDNKEIIQEGNHFFVRVTEDNGEVTESQDYNTIDRAKASIGIIHTIEENNKIISEFMGYHYVPETTLAHDYFMVKGRYIRPHGIKFDTDWNWLMEVVEKIETIKIDKLYFNVQIDKDKVSLFYTHINEPTKQTEMFFEWGQKNKIANIYKIVVEFVKWYNENK
jgi:hypothetical protein